MSDYPFLNDAFLGALEETGAVSMRSGWQPRHQSLEGGWLPLYLRHQSRGEYVFDFSWADAYQRHGLAYYPKLVTAIPYTPVTGPRWRGAPDIGEFVVAGDPGGPGRNPRQWLAPVISGCRLS